MKKTHDLDYIRSKYEEALKILKVELDAKYAVNSNEQISFDTVTELLVWPMFREGWLTGVEVSSDELMREVFSKVTLSKSEIDA